MNCQINSKFKVITPFFICGWFSMLEWIVSHWRISSLKMTKIEMYTIHVISLLLLTYLIAIAAIVLQI